MSIKVSNAVKPSVKAVRKESSSEGSDDEESSGDSSDEKPSKVQKVKVRRMQCFKRSV